MNNIFTFDFLHMFVLNDYIFHKVFYLFLELVISSKTITLCSIVLNL